MRPPLASCGKQTSQQKARAESNQYPLLVSMLLQAKRPNSATLEECGHLAHDERVFAAGRWVS
jgi:hypothetical protein